MNAGEGRGRTSTPCVSMRPNTFRTSFCTTTSCPKNKRCVRQASVFARAWLWRLWVGRRREPTRESMFSLRCLNCAAMKRSAVCSHPYAPPAAVRRRQIMQPPYPRPSQRQRGYPPATHQHLDARVCHAIRSVVRALCSRVLHALSHPIAPPPLLLWPTVGWRSRTA